MLLTFFDIEAGGFDPRTTDIHSFSYIHYDTSEEKIVSAETLYFYWPGMVCQPKALEVHGLTPEFLRSKCPDKETLERNFDRMFKVMHHGCLAGYNSDTFDIKYAQIALLRRNYPDAIPRYKTDLMRVWRPHFRKNVKLQYLMEYLDVDPDFVEVVKEEAFGVSNDVRNVAHTADYDTVCTFVAYVEAKGRGML